MDPERRQKRPKNFARFLFSLGRIVRGMTDDELRCGHEFRIKTLSHPRILSFRPKWRNLLLFPPFPCFDDGAAPSSFSSVMKQILLCVTAMVAEVFLCE